VRATDGVLSYSMPQGDQRAPDVDLRDFTYDGRVADRYLSGGLGQLTDGVEGHSNLRLDPDGWGRRGYEWVGWHNDTRHRYRSNGVAAADSQSVCMPRVLYILLASVPFFFIKKYLLETDYLRICWTDFRQIFTVRS